MGHMWIVYGVIAFIGLVVVIHGIIEQRPAKKRRRYLSRRRWIRIR